MTQETILWDFESEDIGWQARAETIKVGRDEEIGATGNSEASLLIYGHIEDGWNYALSDRRPMKAEGFYRLSAWLLVNSVGPNTPMPYLKCEFVGEDTRSSLGMISTNVYDSGKMNKWQELTAEFRAPEGTVACWVALEKGGNTRMEIDANLDDVKIESIKRLTAFDKYNFDPMPPSLEKVRGIHPRIYLNDEFVKKLQEAVKTTHAHIWDEIQSQADGYLKRGAPKYIEDDGHSGNEQLWQRGVGNAMPYLAMAYLITGEKRYLESAREWAVASCGYKAWGLERTDGMDLAAGHQLLGLGLVYDWCYNGLDDEARNIIREALIKRTSAMFEAAATGKIWWHKSYLQNHLWVNICGMAVAGFALFDEDADALGWIGLPLDKFQRTMAALGDDGASHEGVGYWGYGVEYMLKFMYLAGNLLDVNMYDNDWWRNTATYRQYLALPRDIWTRQNNIVDIADCPRSNWYGPDYMLRHLAEKYRDEYAQWLAQEVDEANVDSSEARWLNLIWFDPDIKPKQPDDLPTLHHFEDMDIVSARSDWSGNESLIVFKCGPYIGHKAVKEFSYDPGGGHVHPDANHFVLFAGGEWLIRDDGYRAKWTGQHNTLLINGKGQQGEGRMWFNGAELLARKALPKIINAMSTPEVDFMTGDATEAYSKDTGLNRYIRHLLFIKPNVLIVVDDITMDKASELELRFHPEQNQAERNGNAFLIQGKQNLIQLELLTNEGVEMAAENVSGEGRNKEQSFSMFTVRMMANQAHWQNAVAISWAKSGDEPAKAKFLKKGEIWTFSVGERVVNLNLSTGEIGPD